MTPANAPFRESPVRDYSRSLAEPCMNAQSSSVFFPEAKGSCRHQGSGGRDPARWHPS
jgi:hypothetical protein